MPAEEIFSPDRHRSKSAGVVVAMLLVGGLTLIIVFIALQRPHQQQPASAGEPATALAEGVDVSRSWLYTKPLSRVMGLTLSRSKPLALNIPSIGVRSVIQYLGQDEEGALDVPAPGPHYDEAAWYRYSPTPGSLGPAIVYGHVDSAIGGPSVFFRLGELQAGSKIFIDRADGSTAEFVVDEVHRYAKDEFPTKVVYSDIDHAGLRILTCGGAFDDATGHYLDNIVVFASLVGSHG